MSWRAWPDPWQPSPTGLLTPVSPQHEYGMSMEHLGSSTYYLAATTGLTAASTPDDDARVLYNFAHHKSLQDAFTFLLGWSVRERRAFSNDELASLIQQATGVDTAGVIAEWLRPLP